METKNLFNVISTTVIIVATAILAYLFYLKIIDIYYLVGLLQAQLKLPTNGKKECSYVLADMLD